MKAAVVGTASKLHSAIATCVSLLALATGGDGVAQPVRAAFGFTGASGDGATLTAPAILAFAMTFQTASMVGTGGVGAQQFHRAFRSTPSSITDAGARHLAAAVAVAAALHGAVHAGEASEAEATALDAAALTATGVGAEGLATWATVASITATLSSWTANTSIVAVVRALLRRHFVQAGRLLEAIHARSWQTGTTAFQLHHHRAALMYHLRAIGALEARTAVTGAIEAVAVTRAVVGAALDVTGVTMPALLADALLIDALTTFVAVLFATRDVADASFPSIATNAARFRAATVTAAVGFAGHRGHRRDHLDLLWSQGLDQGRHQGTSSGSFLRPDQGLARHLQGATRNGGSGRDICRAG
mmetsp:Transcript_72881/g.115824  ORF Transcript_72881/g.115824 Transcript_72881/m.115824 type:complete len:360 (-) Transcript_72881:303-1382(-)